MRIYKSFILNLFLILVLMQSAFGFEPMKDDELEKFASSKKQWTGIAVSKKGRCFVCFPNWSDKHAISVGEIVAGKVIPFPDSNLNSGYANKKSGFLSVQSVFVDALDNLWILDTGNPKFNGVVKEAARLFKVSLKENKIKKVYQFSEPEIQKTSYLNDVRIDSIRNFAYLTDSGEGAIVVLNLKTGKARRVLGNHFSTKSERIKIFIDSILFKHGGEIPNVHADGIALTEAGDRLYFQALTSNTLYAVDTDVLRDFAADEEKIQEKVVEIAKSGPADGLICDKFGRVIVSSIVDSAICRVNSSGRVTTLVENPEKISWPDSFAWFDSKHLLFTNSKIHLPAKLKKDIDYTIFKMAPPAGRILMILTSHGKMGNSDKKTGYYLSELSHPYKVFSEAGFVVDISSVNGGKSVLDPSSLDLDDPSNKSLLENDFVKHQLENTVKLSEVNLDLYDAIFFVGGHGTMFDFPDDPSVKNLIAVMHEQKGVIAAVCHGPAALLNVKLSDGSYFVKGKRLTGFSNREESAVKLEAFMPFALQTKLIEQGASFSQANKPFDGNCVVDGLLVTGQNPASAEAVAKAVVKILIGS